MDATTVSASTAPNLLAELRASLAREQGALVREGEELMHAIGQDGRVPLVAAQRWRFSSQAMLLRALGECHPAVHTFERHCSYGLLSRKRFAAAVAQLHSAVRCAESGTVDAQLGVVCMMLEPLAHRVDDDSVAVALWQALVVLATLAGLRGPGENPARTVLVDRLVKRGLFEDTLATALVSQDAQTLRGAAERLLTALRGDQSDF